MPDAQLILIGLRGSGKSTLARLLGEQLGTRAIDLDDRTAALLHAPSPGDAFRKAGQAAFRAAEARALSTALAENPRVLALGGGTPTAPGAADQLRLWAAAVPGLRKIVYLAASPQTLAARLADTDPASRPALLGGADPLAEIAAVHAIREPLYRALATDVLDADRLTHAQALAALSALASGND